MIMLGFVFISSISFEWFQVSEALMLGPGPDLFDFMADCLLHFMIEHDLLGQHYRLGFTFSFPTNQRALAKAELSTW